MRLFQLFAFSALVALAMGCNAGVSEIGEDKDAENIKPPSEAEIMQGMSEEEKKEIEKMGGLGGGTPPEGPKPPEATGADPRNP